MPATLLTRGSSSLRPFLLTLFAPLLAAQSVPCEKYRLPNGLTVILYENHRVPSVVVNTWFHVGAKDEPPQRSGFAHLFEHLMFMGTERVPGSSFDEWMEAGGGGNNASTTEDRTNYFSNGPAHILPTLLWLDADRFEDVGRTMDQAKLDRQREIVRNEIRQQVEQQPYGRVERDTFHLLFPPGHPYHEGTYGSHADLEAATVDDVRGFFATFYVPANASLVVAGDFDPARTKPLIASLFGSLPAAPEPTRRVVEPPQLERVVRTTQLDHVEMPLVRMAWHAPRPATAGTAELELLAELLARGKDSRLYRRLVDGERCAIGVDASFDSLALGSLFTIDVYAKADADLDRVEALVDEVLGELREAPVAADELDRRKIAREVGQLAALQDLGYVADRLNHYEFLWGEPDSFARDLERYRAVQPAGLRDIARSVLDPHRRAILRVLPIDATRAASARDTRPADLAPAPLAVEAPTEFRLGNGMRVLHWLRPELPLTAIRVLATPKSPLVTKGDAGAAALAADMLSEGAGDLDAAGFAGELGRLGARLTAWVDHESANVSLFVLQRNFASAVHRLADAVRRPHLGAAEFTRAHAIRLAGLQAGEEEPTTVAARVAMRVLFGDDDPYGWPAGGAAETFAGVDLPQVQRAFASAFDPAHTTLLVAGAATVDEVRRVLETEFGDWRSGGAVHVAVGAVAAPARPAGRGLRLVVVDRPDAPQTVLHVLAPAPAYAVDGRMRRQLLGMALGGTFTSRLNQNLREQHGYTYGARADFAAGPWRGWFVARTSVATPVTGPALGELLGELQRLRGERGDVTADEVGKVQQTLRAGFVDARASLEGLLAQEAEFVLEGRDSAQLQRDLAAAGAIDAAAIDAASPADLDLDHGVLVLVGDCRQIVSQLRDLPQLAGLVPEYRDVHGVPAPAPAVASPTAPETAERPK